MYRNFFCGYAAYCIFFNDIQLELTGNSSKQTHSNIAKPIVMYAENGFCDIMFLPAK